MTGFTGNPKDNQEVLNFAFQKMIEQGRKSKSESSSFCQYRGPCGKCIAGHLIPNEEYYPDIENLPCCEVDFFKKFNIMFIWDLQLAHDTSNSRKHFIDKIKEVVNERNLKMPKYDENWVNLEIW